MKIGRKAELWLKVDRLTRRKDYLMQNYETAGRQLKNLPTLIPDDSSFGKLITRKSELVRHTEFLGYVLLRVEQDIVETEDVKLWWNDLRLRNIYHAMGLYDRAQRVQVDLRLDPDGVTLTVKRRELILQQEFPYSQVGIMACNQILCPLEDELDAVERNAEALLAQGPVEGGRDHAIRMAWMERMREEEARMAHFSRGNEIPETAEEGDGLSANVWRRSMAK